ncbi:MAG: bifunctional DNA primase/polymerase [Terracidiphilus sp.]|jgi:hypothetical protein
MKHCFLRKFDSNSQTLFATGSTAVPLRETQQNFDLLRDAALRGWKIFPVLTLSRHAMGAPAMLAQATNDLEQLETWASQYPGCRWALATGCDSGVLAIEMDGRIGTASFSWLLFESQEVRMDNSPTLISQTENGGEDTVCAYYRWPAGMPRHLLRGVIAPGMTLRGEGDYVIIPPSVRRDGIRYLYLQPDIEVALVPDFVIELACESFIADAVRAREKLPPQRAVQESPGSFESSSAG